MVKKDFSAARLKLYEYMKMVQFSPGCSVIYTDTDSVMFSCPRGKNPIPEGSFLGEMSREYPEYELTEIVCAGPKQYALKMQQKTNGEIKYLLRCRGITLDHHNSSKLTFDKFKKLVLAAYSEKDEEEDMPTFDYTRLGPDKFSQVLTTKMTKIYRCVNTKGYEHNSLIYPFGFE
jgi:Zn-finger nucleic acid-binding protein